MVKTRQRYTLIDIADIDKSNLPHSIVLTGRTNVGDHVQLILWDDTLAAAGLQPDDISDFGNWYEFTAEARTLRLQDGTIVLMRVGDFVKNP